MYIFSFVMIKKGRCFFFFFFCIFQLNNNLTELFLNLKKNKFKRSLVSSSYCTSIHPFFITTSPWLGVVGVLESIPAVSGWYTGVIHRGDTQGDTPLQGQHRKATNRPGSCSNQKLPFTSLERLIWYLHNFTSAPHLAEIKPLCF